MSHPNAPQVPSKEGLDAAKEIFQDNVLQGLIDSDGVERFESIAARCDASIIDRHFQPLREQLVIKAGALTCLAKLYNDLREENTHLRAKAQLADELADFCAKCFPFLNYVAGSGESSDEYCLILNRRELLLARYAALAPEQQPQQPAATDPRS